MKSSITTFAKWVAIISFLLGTVLITTYYFFETTELIIFGYFYLVTVGLVNFAVLVVLLYAASDDSANRREILGTAGFMTINIPVAILYLYFFLVLTNTMRITFINETGETLSELVIDGCETIEIVSLQPNERTTCWIDIPRDCSITLEYSKSGLTTKEQVFGYVTTSMGQKETYIIGKSKESIDETF